MLLLQRERYTDKHHGGSAGGGGGGGDGECTWSPLHLEAARIPNPSIMALTPPRCDDPLDKDVNARGPGACGLSRDTPQLLTALVCDINTDGSGWPPS